MFSDKYSIPDDLLEELWEIRNPHIQIADDPEAFERFRERLENRLEQEKPEGIPGESITRKAFFELTTGRNRQLITQTEQDRLRKAAVGVFGLSVGSHVALTWMMQSRADVIKIMDPDTVSATNLNRLRAGWKDVGRKKTALVEESLLEINPFAQVIASTETDQDTVRGFFFDEPTLDVVVDAIDDMEGKLILRRHAKERGIPLVSAADVGDNVVLDIERYDLHHQPEPFLGRIKDIETVDFSRLSETEKKKLIIQLVGFDQTSERMVASIMAIGGSVPTWPQLGATATIAGGIVTSTIKKMLLGEKIKSGRYHISLDDMLVADYNEEPRRQVREKKIRQVERLIEEA